MIDYQLVRSDFENPQEKAMRDAFGEAMIGVGEKREDVVVITADLGKSLRILKFRDKFPERYFNVGVAEQNMVGVAAGMATEEYIPVVSSFAVFSPGRSWDQVRLSVASMNTNVKMVGSHAGLSVGENGATHQSLEDIASMRVLPNMTVLSPADYNQTIAATEAMIEYDGPVYLRFPRAESAVFTKEREFEVGKAYVYREGKDLTLCATGIFVWDALIVAEKLGEEGVSVEVINVSTIKPLDEKVIVSSVKKTGLLVSLEDHQIMGGLGGALAETVSEKVKFNMMRLGVRDSFGESGNYKDLYKKYGLDVDSLYRSISKFIHGRL